MQDHQKRVIAEKNALDENLNKLRAFIETSLYQQLDSGEQECLSRQQLIMTAYSQVLGERIAAWQ